MLVYSIQAPHKEKEHYVTFYELLQQLCASIVLLTVYASILLLLSRIVFWGVQQERGGERFPGYKAKWLEREEEC